MNAIQFIQQHGVEKAREVVEGAPKYSKHVIPCLDGEMYFAQREDGTWFRYSNGYGKWFEYFGKCNPLDLAYDLSDLKRLVESVDIVNDHGGLETIKRCVEKTIFPLSDRIIRMKQAIADYETIYSGEKHV